MLRKLYHFIKYTFCNHYWEDLPFFEKEMGFSHEPIYFYLGKLKCKRCMGILLIINDICGKNCILDSYYIFNYIEK